MHGTTAFSFSPEGEERTARQFSFSLSHPRVSKGGLDVIRKEAWPFYRTSSGVRLCWELEEPKGPKTKARGEEGAEPRASHFKLIC